MIYIKYCGGCNPRYDRGSLVRSVIKKFPHLIFDFKKCNNQQAAVIVCGCSCCCANRDEVNDMKHIVISSEAEAERMISFIKQLQCVD